MTDRDIDLPSNWQQRIGDERTRNTLAACQRDTTKQSRFIVSVVDKTQDRDELELRLSTIDRTSRHVRHDHPVDTDDTADDAVAAAATFVEFFEGRLTVGTVSKADPSIDEMRPVIQNSPTVERSDRSVGCEPSSNKVAGDRTAIPSPEEKR